MWRSLIGLSLLASMTIFIAGCSLVQPLESKVQSEPARQMSMDQLKEIESFFVECETSVPTLDPKELKAGQHIQIIAGSSPNTLNQEVLLLTSRIAGTVKEVSADRVILQDVVMIKEGRTQHAVPVVSKVPYFNRRFKSTGVRREVTPVPGEVAIELSEILHAKELTDSGFEEVREYGVERIGVDFDFNVAEGRPAITPQ